MQNDRKIRQQWSINKKSLEPCKCNRFMIPITMVDHHFFTDAFTKVFFFKLQITLTQINLQPCFKKVCLQTPGSVSCLPFKHITLRCNRTLNRRYRFPLSFQTKLPAIVTCCSLQVTWEVFLCVLCRAGFSNSGLFLLIHYRHNVITVSVITKPQTTVCVIQDWSIKEN